MKRTPKPFFPYLQPKQALWLSTGIALALYLVHFGRQYVGSYGDDTTYIMGALALLQKGRYVSLNHPLEIPITQFPPGYSLFLTPFVKMWAPHWDALRGLSIVLTLASVGVLWAFLKEGTTVWVRWIICTLFLWNPITQRLASAVLSEPLFLLLSLLSFYVFRRCVSGSAPAWMPYLLGLLVGWCSIVRTVGVILIPAMILALLHARRWKVLAQSLPLMILPAAYLAYRNVHHTGAATNHLQLLTQMLGYIFQNGAGAWMDHLQRMANLFFVLGLGALKLPYSILGKLLNAILVFLLLGCLGIGIRSTWMNSKFPRVVTLAVGLYAGGYLAIYAFWISIDSRYVFPLLPFLAWFVIEGTRVLKRQHPRLNFVWILCGGLLLSSYAYASLVWLKPPVSIANRNPEQTYAWIRKNLPETAYILDARPSMLYLYTQRRSIGSLQATDIENFRYWMLRNNVTHVLYQPLYAVAVRKTYSSAESNFAWVGGWPDAFPELYRNDQEKAIIYRVNPSPEFVKAYDRYLSAQHALALSDSQSAKRQLKELLHHYPTLACAQRAYAALLTHDGDLPGAEKHLRMATTLRLHYPLALLDLARLYRRQGHLELAKDNYVRALQAIPLSGEDPVLTPLIQQELASL